MINTFSPASAIKKLTVLIFLGVFALGFDTQAQLCEKTFFLKTYTDSDSMFVNANMIPTPDGGAIVTGVVKDYNGTVFRLDDKGNKIWEIILFGPGVQTVTKIIRTRDGNYVVTGTDEQYLRPYLMKFTINGNVLWRKTLNSNTTNEFPGIGIIAEDPGDGHLYSVSFHQFSMTSGFSFVKYDADGNVLLARYFRKSSATTPHDIQGIIIKDGFSYLCGYYINTDSPPYYYNGYLSKIDNISGEMKWSRLYNSDGNSQIFQQIFDYDKNQLLLTGKNDVNGSNLENIMICDLEGNVNHFVNYEFNTERQFGKCILDKQKNIVYVNFYSLSDPSDLLIASVNPFTGINWAYRYPQLKNLPRVNDAASGPAGELFFSGTAAPQRAVSFVGKFTADGKAGCDPIAVVAKFGTSSSVKTERSFATIEKSFVMQPVALPALSNEVIAGNLLCEMSTTCSELSLSGRPLYCDPDLIGIEFKKNAGCYSVPDFLFDSAKIKFEYIKDDSAFFSTTHGGQFRFYGRIISQCDTLLDSIDIKISKPGSRPQLGQDQTICNGSSKIVLEAGTGFNTYLWQDGSRSPSFVATKPGEYWVQVSDFCGNIFSDTVIIRPWVPVAFSLGGDKTVCNDNPVQITAPLGFLNYRWTPGTGVDFDTARVVNVLPPNDITYIVTAEATPGCFSRDTINIFKRNAPAIFLGNDTSFCNGQQILLDAGPGFQQYSWNNGSTAQKIIVSVAGSYIVTATTADQCKSNDTLIVKEIYPVPVPELGSGSGICKGTSIQLDPGRFSSYQWHDGTVSPSYTASGPGTYSVAVTNQFGCKNADTVVISNLFSPPSKFLPSDTSVCSYPIFQLAPNNSYSSYQWNNGYTNASINVVQTGEYILQVTDHNQCVGSDTINVKIIECVKGIYFPNAFTPNGDGLNDIFRPIARGELLFFRFNIYNRWGEQIYSTSDPNKGWDGNLQGRSQSSAVFVWTCQYEFEGEVRKTAKGTVRLIR